MFRIKSIIPVGVTNVEKEELCGLCSGKTSEVCFRCIGQPNTCSIIKVENNKFHRHCVTYK